MIASLNIDKFLHICMCGCKWVFSVLKRSIQLRVAQTHITIVFQFITIHYLLAYTPYFHAKSAGQELMTMDMCSVLCAHFFFAVVRRACFFVHNLLWCWNHLQFTYIICIYQRLSVHLRRSGSYLHWCPNHGMGKIQLHLFSKFLKSFRKDFFLNIC